MCMSSPKIDTTPPTTYQTPKEVTPKKAGLDKPAGGMAGGSLLTGPAGVSTAAGNIAGANSLLGG